MPSAHLLLIEDDPNLASITMEELEDGGYQVTVAGTVMQGLMHAREHQPDLIITDLGLPDGDGREVVTRLRRTLSLPIIVLTARDDVAEKVALLNLGADDYLVKPVSPRELLIRVWVQLRQGDDTLIVGDLSVSSMKRLATWQGSDLRLSDRELSLLTLLMQQPGRVYSRADMARVAWNGELALDSNVIDVHLSNLRQKLQQQGAPNLLRTVRGVGYALKVEPGQSGRGRSGSNPVDTEDVQK
jgi:two-component system, OmpR family, copper resistance phosphate regulon response regulator CusR